MTIKQSSVVWLKKNINNQLKETQIKNSLDITLLTFVFEQERGGKHHVIPVYDVHTDTVR